MREKNYTAFTLVELLIVAIIIGLLSSLALATYARCKEHAVRTRIFAAVEEWNRVHSVFLANSLMHFYLKKNLHERRPWKHIPYYVGIYQV